RLVVHVRRVRGRLDDRGRILTRRVLLFGVERLVAEFRRSLEGHVGVVSIDSLDERIAPGRAGCLVLFGRADGVDGSQEQEGGCHQAQGGRAVHDHLPVLASDLRVPGLRRSPYISSSANSTQRKSINRAPGSTRRYSGRRSVHGRENTLESSMVAS